LRERQQISASGSVEAPDAGGGGSARSLILIASAAKQSRKVFSHEGTKEGRKARRKAASSSRRHFFFVPSCESILLSGLPRLPRSLAMTEARLLAMTEALSGIQAIKKAPRGALPGLIFRAPEMGNPGRFDPAGAPCFVCLSTPEARINNSRFSGLRESKIIGYATKLWANRWATRCATPRLAGIAKERAPARFRLPGLPCSRSSDSRHQTVPIR
jgi:hypothetical protein